MARRLGFLRMDVYGKLTLPGLLGVNHWVVIIPLLLVRGRIMHEGHGDRRAGGVGARSWRGAAPL